MHIAEAPVEAYAHCRDPRCEGYSQEAIDGTREETFFTFGDGGGDGIFTTFVEKSMVEFKAVNESDIPCPACGEPREVTGTHRPSYQPLSGHDPMGLLKNAKFDAGKVNTPQDAQTAALEARLAVMADQIAALTESLADKDPGE